MNKQRVDSSSTSIRKRILEIASYAKRGHLSSAFSCVEMVDAMYESILHINPNKPKSPSRDRFIFSKGHGCLALYVVLAKNKFFPSAKLNTFCEFDSMLGGHPQFGKIPGLEASTGSLGHGFSIAVGIAVSGLIDKQKYRTFILLSDGECDEGTTWEAALHASKHRLDRLVVLLDYNKLQCYADTSTVLELEPLALKWESFGFDVHQTDGHDKKAIVQTVHKALKIKGKPHVIICHTVKGKGLKSMENEPSWHHKSKILDEEIEKLMVELTK